MTADKTAKKQRGKPFPPGASGNPEGRPKGSRNATTLMVQALLDGEAEAIGKMAIELAKAGDLTAIRLVLERVLPARKDSPVTFPLPEIKGAADTAEAMRQVMAALASGELAPSEAQAVFAMLEAMRKAYETGEIEQRLITLEAQLAKK